MGKYQTYQKQKELPRNEVHPVWRGIGCLIVIITPIISWAAAQVLLELGKTQKWAFLYELSDNLRFPDYVYKIPGILVAANYISGIAYLKALLLFFFLVLILLSGVFALLNAILYRMIGPPRYTAIDAPAPRVKTKRYTR
jgi:hypothetical protein